MGYLTRIALVTTRVLVIQEETVDEKLVWLRPVLTVIDRPFYIVPTRALG